MELVGGRFLIQAKVAAGGMGVVYKAKDTTTGELVALKVIENADTETVERFAREGTILADLEHPSIVRYVARGTTAAGKPYLAMAWVEGETLHARLERHGVSIVESIQLGIRLAGGLAHAHVHGVVHRDVKPSNVLLPTGALEQAMIVDFGIARTAGSTRSLTVTGTMIGTPSYMAPEQARGERVIDARTDMFSLGCVLYECLTGQRAFEGKHALALIAKVVLWEPPAPSSLNAAIPESLDRLIVQMLAKSPADRPDDAMIVAELGRYDLSELAREVRGAPSLTSPRAPDATSKVSAQQVSVVIATTPAGADGCSDPLSSAESAERRTTIAAILGPHRVRAEVLTDGSILVISADSSPKRGVRCAINCARAILTAVPSILIAITTGDLEPASDPDGTAIDNVFEVTVSSLAKEAMARMFSHASSVARPAGAIRLDPATERFVDDEPIVRIAGVGYIAGQAG